MTSKCEWCKWEQDDTFVKCELCKLPKNAYPILVKLLKEELNSEKLSYPGAQQLIYPLLEKAYKYGMGISHD